MKVLILGPIDYPSIRKDLQLINYNNKVYSTYYAFEGMYAATNREGKMLEGGTTELFLYLSETMRDSEYNVCDILFGFVPKTRHVDKVICYNYDTLSSQEALMTSYFKDFPDKFYTTADITDRVDNIMEAIKLAQYATGSSDTQ